MFQATADDGLIELALPHFLRMFRDFMEVHVNFVSISVCNALEET